MIRRIFLPILHFLSAPLRYVIRYELKKTIRQVNALHHRMNNPNQSLKQELYLRARQKSAVYIEENMGCIKSVDNKFDLLTLAMETANLAKAPLVCEFGVFSGETINHLARLTTLPVYGFDSFEGLPEYWRDGFEKGHFGIHGLPKVECNVTLVKGWFDESLPHFIGKHSEDIGLLHVDCDLYSSTKTIFRYLGDRIKPGCVIVFDEYFNYPGWENDEFKAFQEFIKEGMRKYEYLGYNCLHEQVALRITE